jgi:flagellar motility protein MotE (MotC chaperone)
MRGRGSSKRGALTIIAGLLVASAVVRSIGTVGPAMAVGADEVAEPAEIAESMVCGPEDTPEALIQALQDREARAVAREAQIADRMQALAVAEAEIEEKLGELAAAEESLAALLALANTASEDDLNRLTAVYENMKPQDAAALFEEMEPAFSAGFMGRMRPESAAAIMTNLEAQTAYLISVVLAGRNANAPTE